MTNVASVKKRERVKARRNTVQALYEWFMTGKEVADVIAEFEVINKNWQKQILNILSVC